MQSDLSDFFFAVHCNDLFHMQTKKHRGGKYMRKEVADMSAEVKMLMEERARQCVLKEEEKT